MAKQLDPAIADILKRYGEDPRTALWDCHGTWVVYHKAIERIAAKAGITFDMPEVVQADARDKIAVIIARGFMGERSEWSFGEAMPSNNKNAYPFAMAEKRAKDRVVLKLVGLHGLVYSEDEDDSFKGNGETLDIFDGLANRIRNAKTVDELRAIGANPSFIGDVSKLPDEWKQNIRVRFSDRLVALTGKAKSVGDAA